MNYFDKNKPLQSFPPAFLAILTTPKSFFTTIPTATFHSTALFFASIIIFIASFLAVPAHSLGVLFLVPVIWGLSLIALWAWSAFMAWAVKAVGGGKLGPATSFLISAYAAAPLLLAGVPYAGAIAGVWSLYLLWVALVNRCKLAPGKALLIILAPTLLIAVSLTGLLRELTKLFPQLA